MITPPNVAAACIDYDRCAVGACIPATPCEGCPALLAKRHKPAAELGAGWALREAAGRYSGSPINWQGAGAVDSEGGHAD